MIISLLGENVDLPKSKFKKLSGADLFELRVKSRDSIYRGIGGFLKPDFVIVLFFKKKSQKTPLSILLKAQKRYNELF